MKPWILSFERLCAGPVSGHCGTAHVRCRGWAHLNLLFGSGSALGHGFFDRRDAGGRKVCCERAKRMEAVQKIKQEDTDAIQFRGTTFAASGTAVRGRFQPSRSCVSSRG